MNVTQFFEEALTTDHRISHENTDAKLFRPMSGHRVRMHHGRIARLDDATHRRIAAMLGLPVILERALPDEVADKVWDSLWERELAKPRSERQIPARLRISMDGDEIVGVQNGDFVLLSVGNVAEALLSLANSRLNFKSATVRSHKLDHTGFTLRFTFPTLATAPRRDDVVEGGLEIVHSTTGHSPTRVRNCLYRLVCANGMTTQVCVGDKTLRLRTRSEKQFAHAEMIASLTAVLQEAANQLEQKLEGIRCLANERVDAFEHIRQIALRHRLSKKVVGELKYAFTKDELGPAEPAQATMFDVVNALSRVATHGRTSNEDGQDWTIRDNVRESLALLSGTLAASPVHLCPTCRRILSPSSN